VFAQRDDSSRPEDIPGFARAGLKTIYPGVHVLAGLNTPHCWLARSC
jgi:hypothetical protein